MRRTVLSAIGALGAVVLFARQASPPPPTFHAGVDVVQLDVTVLDKQQEPVPGLTAGDFTVLEDGKPRPIVAFSVMQAPEASPNAAPWTRVVPLDVVTNQLDMHRLMVIVLDDRLIPAGMTGAAAAVANRAIDRLGPGDEAAVVFTAYGQNQNLTTDHAALHKAVASLSPHPPSKPRQGKMDPGMVGRIAGILQNAPVGRKILLSISPAPHMGLLLTDGSSPQDIRRELQAANITVYTFDLHGVQTGSATADGILTPHGGFAMGPPIVFTSPNDLSVLTGGRAIVGTNDPWDGIENVYRESRLYYLVGFDRGAPADGKLHDVSVKVNRPGVEVRTRSSYVAPDGASAKASAAPRDDGSAPDPVDEALAQGLPGGDMPLRVVVTPVAARDGSNTVLIIGAEIGRMPSAGGAPPTQRVNLVATALDKDWNARQTERQTVDLSTTDGASGHEVLSRLLLAHGRYDVRVAAESDGHTGNVFVDVDVPDLVGPDLALSGVFLSQHPGVPAGPRDALVDLIPVVPATTRTFSRADHVTAFVRVYEGRSGRLRPATVTTGIVNDQNARVFEHASSIAATAFGSDRSADVSLDLPLDQLSHGDYVVAIEVTDGDHQQYRYERFSMN